MTRNLHATAPLPLIAALLLLAGCGRGPTAPPAEPLPAGGIHSGVPDFSSARVRYADGMLRLEAAPATPWTMAPFDPKRQGGWCFQLFINADQRSTGYGPGMDYVLRAVEVAPGGGVDVRRAEGGGGPGGWGEAVGRVALRAGDGAVECAIPLEILGPDDGRVDFVLEIYRTMEKPASEGGGVWHEFTAAYAGTSAPYGAGGTALRRGLAPLAPGANRVP